MPDGVPLQRPRFEQVKEKCIINNYGYNYMYVRSYTNPRYTTRKPMSVTARHCSLSIAFSVCYTHHTCILNAYDVELGTGLYHK